ncbi:MAG: sigma 54-interacting transcriptional regulator [Lysobacter sp.]|nr:sigma 54-interacting transcriptional regulator [Lysobacter sp.]
MVTATQSQRSLIGSSDVMAGVMAYAAKIARTDSTVLITGETGTGKECFAKYVHERSRRGHRALLCINCAALPDALLEGELFGYERGAFTGAHQAYPGKLKLAEGGTLLLDEIGELSLVAQAKLLRVIEDHEVFRLGGRRSEPVDVRIIAATNQEIEPMVAERRFRPDLFYRLNVARLHVPPLRQRREDIPLLFAHYMLDISQRTGVSVGGLSPEALQCLIQYSWPGNVRELKNMVEALFIDPPDGRIELRHLPSRLIGRMDALASADVGERERILTALFDTHWNKCRAAKQLNWSRMTLYRKISKYQITKPAE